MKVECVAEDSDLLSIKVGRCKLTNILEWEALQKSDWDVVYIAVDPTNKDVNDHLAANDVFLADKKTTFILPIKDLPKDSNRSPRIRSYTTSNADNDVIKVGMLSRAYSRFMVDERFSDEKASLIYSTLMKRSINRDQASEVYVWESEVGEIAGVITLGEKNRRADIGILAVDERYRGNKIGKELVGAAIHFSMDKGYQVLQVVTQGDNTVACKFYESCGFTKENVVNIYHYWRAKE
jgi:dTDP-4-amino-4,6-dideoxy-D-galactose acyltransferase